MSGLKKAITDSFPAPVYRRTVLEEIFRNAKVYFLQPLLAIEYAHTLMLASRALIQTQGVLTSLHNTPFADMNDAEDDLQPTAYNAFDDAPRALDLAAGLLQTARFNIEVMEDRAHSNFLTVTELADVLVRSGGIDFRTAHEIVSLAVKEAGHTDGKRDPQKIVDGVERAFPQLTGRTLELDRQVLHRALDPRHFVEVRKTPGGPAAEVLELTIEAAREKLAADTSWVKAAAAHIERARQRLEKETEAFLAGNPVA